MALVSLDPRAQAVLLQLMEPAARCLIVDAQVRLN
jgi:hypothetical protein